MTKPTTLKRSLESVRRLCDAKKYREAFAQAEILRQDSPENVEVLVLWANLLQLQDENAGPPLEEAKNALVRATELEQQNPLPWIELGQYLFVMDDDARAAAKCFARASALARTLLKDALIGQSKSLAELIRRREAISCLADAFVLETRNGKHDKGTSGQDLLDRLLELSTAS